ncbi:MAG: potassium channel family protein [Caldimicrobium sp.]
MEYKRHIYISLIWLFSLILGGTIGYMVIEGARFLDSLFMVIITITTIGYEEYVPLSDKGKIFTIVLSLGGIGLFFYIVTFLSETVVKKTMENLWEKKSIKKLTKIRNHCIICGYGRIGKYIYEFIKESLPVLIIEKNPESIKELKEKNAIYLEGDATLEETLLKAGIKKAKYLIASLGDDAQNVYIVLTARNLNPHLYIIARADNPEVEKKLYQAGANRVFLPYAIGARKMALSILKPNVMDFIDITSPETQTELQIEEILVEEKSYLTEKTIRDSNIRGRTKAIILAIKRQTGELLLTPGPDTIILPNDILIVLGEKTNLEKLSNLAKKSTK